MTELIILRVLGDVCLYFAVVGAFPLFFAHDFMLLYPALLCAAGAGAAAELSRKWPGPARYAALLLPLVSLLLADEPMEYLLLAPVLLYTALLIHRNAYGLEYYGFRDQFLNLGRILCVFAGIVFALGYFEGMFGSSWESCDISAVLLYGLIYGLTGVFLMRQLRMGPDSLPRDRMANHVQMAVVLAVILCLALLAVALEESMRDLISWAIYTVIGIASVIPMIIHELIFWFMKEDGHDYMDALASARPEPTETTMEMTYPTYSGATQPLPPEEGYPWWLAVLVLAALCCVMVFLLRSLRKGGGGLASAEDTELVDLPEAGQGEPRRSNRNKVRKIYRNYLKLVRRKGQCLKTDQTTADILENYPENTNVEAAARLRQVYLKARYDSEHPVTDREVEQAKAAMKQVTNYHKTR